MHGTFVGLSYLDLIQTTSGSIVESKTHRPTSTLVAAGGPATNAATAFANIDSDNIAHLITRISPDSIGRTIISDLTKNNVALTNMPIGSNKSDIMYTNVNSNNGAVTVVGDTDKRDTAPPQVASDWVNTLPMRTDIVVLDGHEVDLAVLVANKYREQAPVILRIDSADVTTNQLLDVADIVIANKQYVPSRDSAEKVFHHHPNIKYIVITNGSDTISVFDVNHRWEIPACDPVTVDTLAVGDFFHGAFAHYLADKPTNYPDILAATRYAALIAGISVEYSGTREWLKHIQPQL